MMEIKAIGYIQTVFKYKNGTPRQPMLCENARGVLRIEKSVFNNPDHSLQDLERFSHAWIVFYFHKNGHSAVKAKVKPPRLDGRRVGVFSTRSPHRPNPIGLTLAKIDHIQGDCIHFSGIDILDGTPVLDVKPYIPEYDSPTVFRTPTPDVTASQEKVPQGIVGIDLSKDDLAKSRPHDAMENRINEQSRELNVSGDIHSLVSVPPQPTNSPLETAAIDSDPLAVSTSIEISQVDCSSGDLSGNSAMSTTDDRVQSCSATKGEDTKDDRSINKEHSVSQPSACVSSSWIPKVDSSLKVRFTTRAMLQINSFSKSPDAPNQLELFSNPSELHESIVSILSEDPRSVYRRRKCGDSLYYFTVDTAHVTCWFEGDTAEVVRVQSVTLVSYFLPEKKVNFGEKKTV